MKTSEMADKPLWVPATERIAKSSIAASIARVRKLSGRSLADVLLASISGGTDITSCFVVGKPILPVWGGEIQCIGLGLAVEVRDDGGRS